MPPECLPATPQSNCVSGGNKRYRFAPEFEKRKGRQLLLQNFVQETSLVIQTSMEKQKLWEYLCFNLPPQMNNNTATLIATECQTMQNPAQLWLL